MVYKTLGYIVSHLIMITRIACIVGQVSVSYTHLIDLTISRCLDLGLLTTVGPLCPRILHPQIQPTEDSKYLEEKFQKVPKKQSLNVPRHWQLFTYHLHFIYNYLHSIYITLGITSNPEMT